MFDFLLLEWDKKQNFFQILIFRNIEKIKADAIWNDESQRWKIPELTYPKTKLPPAGELKLFFDNRSAVFLSKPSKFECVCLSLCVNEREIDSAVLVQGIQGF